MHSLAFQKIDKEVFDYSNTKRATMIIKILNGWTHKDDKARAREEAEKLREKGVLIYVTYDAASDHLVQTDEHFKDAQAYAGEEYPWRMHGSKVSSHEQLWTGALDEIRKHFDSITRDLCTFCKFTKNQAGCQSDKRLKGSEGGYFDSKNARCEFVNHTSISCQKKDCEFECNSQWPWNNPRQCNDWKPHQCVDLYTRVGSVPLGMENCPDEMKCSGTCPTTTTTEMSTITKMPAITKLPTTTPNMEANQVSTPKPDNSNILYLIIIVSVVGVVVLIAILIVVFISTRSSAAKKKALWDLEQFQKKREEEKERYRRHIMLAKAAMTIDIEAPRKSAKPVLKSTASPSS